MSPLEQLTRKVLAELTAAYGARFARQYEGADPELVRRAWGRQLFGLSNEAIGWALRHLGEYPPNAMQFRASALQRPTEYCSSLPEPRPPLPDKERLEKLLGRARTIQNKHPRQWAYDLRERERNGERLTLAQRQMWRAAVPEGDRQQPCKPHET